MAAPKDTPIHRRTPLQVIPGYDGMHSVLCIDENGWSLWQQVRLSNGPNGAPRFDWKQLPMPFLDKQPSESDGKLAEALAAAGYRKE